MLFTVTSSRSVPVCLALPAAQTFSPQNPSLEASSPQGPALRPGRMAVRPRRAGSPSGGRQRLPGFSFFSACVWWIGHRIWVFLQPGNGAYGRRSAVSFLVTSLSVSLV